MLRACHFLNVEQRNALAEPVIFKVRCIVNGVVVSGNNIF